MPDGAQLVDVLPDAERQAREVRRAEARRLRRVGADDRHVEDVGLELHQEIVLRRAAIDLQRRNRALDIGRERLVDIAHLIGKRRERRADDMRALRAFLEPDDHAARLRVPIWRRKPAERRHEVDATRIGHELRDPFRIRHRLQDAETVLEPFKARARNEHRTLERIRDLVADAPGDRRDETVLRVDDVAPGIHQEERAFAIRVLRVALREACLSEEIGLLVADTRRNRDGRAEARRIRVAEKMA